MEILWQAHVLRDSAIEFDLSDIRRSKKHFIGMRRIFEVVLFFTAQERKQFWEKPLFSHHHGGVRSNKQPDLGWTARQVQEYEALTKVSSELRRL